MAKPELSAEAGSLVEQVVVAGAVGGEGARLRYRADVVEGHRGVDVLVGVDADHDSTMRRDRVMLVIAELHR